MKVKQGRYMMKSGNTVPATQGNPLVPPRAQNQIKVSKKAITIQYRCGTEHWGCPLEGNIWITLKVRSLHEWNFWVKNKENVEQGTEKRSWKHHQCPWHKLQSQQLQQAQTYPISSCYIHTHARVHVYIYIYTFSSFYLLCYIECACFTLTQQFYFNLVFLMVGDLHYQPHLT